MQGLRRPLLSACAHWLRITSMQDSKAKMQVVTTLLLDLTGLGKMRVANTCDVEKALSSLTGHRSYFKSLVVED